jgi:PTS system galactitol-specific IIC component
MVTALLLIPRIIFLSLILSGINFIPLGDLGNVMGGVVFIVIATNGNVFRSILISLPIFIGHMFIASRMAPIITELAKKNEEILGNYQGMITSFNDGGHLFKFLMIQVFSGNFRAITILVCLLILFFFQQRLV